jgi:hypothetical protein
MIVVAVRRDDAQVPKSVCGMWTTAAIFQSPNNLRQRYNNQTTFTIHQIENL